MKKYHDIFCGADNIYTTRKYVVKQTFSRKTDRKGNVWYNSTDTYIPKTQKALTTAKMYGLVSGNERCKFNGRRKVRYIK